MIYILPFQSEDLFKIEFFNLRNVMNPITDVVHLTIASNHLEDHSIIDIYKKILKLDGKYRSEMNKWDTQSIKVKVVEQQ